MNILRPGKLVEDTSASSSSPATEVEGELRELIRRDVAPLRKPPAEAVSETGPGNVSSLIERVSGTSVKEIDKLITDLQSLRDFLQNEGQRIQREIAGYAQLSQAAMKSTKAIAESVAQCRSAVESSRGDRA